MSSKLQIWNLALANIKQTPSIQGVNEDSSEANFCRVYYEDALKDALQKHDWNFAKKRLSLAVIDDERNREDWEYQYGYPNDCLQARYIVTPRRDQSPIPFEVAILPSTGLGNSADQKVIWTDKYQAVLSYTYFQENTTFFSQKFTIALSWKLSSLIAQPITNKASIEAAALAQYQEKILEAQAANMNEGRGTKQSNTPNAFTEAHY